MNSSKRWNDKESGKGCLRLPKPDPANITVITHNLPNKPILPWTHFDSPWLESEESDSEELEPDSLESTQNSQQESTNSKPKIDK